MHKHNTQGFTIVYLIFIISIVVGLWMVVITKQSFLTTLVTKTQTQNTLLDQASQRAVFQLKRFQTLAEEVKYNIAWFVANNWKYQTLFWNPQIVMDFMWSNPNIWTDKKYLSSITSWYVEISVDQPFDLKILEINKNNFSTNKTIQVTQENNIYSPAVATGYIKADYSIQTSTWGYLNFDFANKNYAFLMKVNSWTTAQFAQYSLKVYDQVWSGIYINPIHDWVPGNIQYKTYDITNFWWKYLYEIFNF